MNLSELLEDGGKDLVIIYPGRFHPFHIGHGKVYKYLKEKYSNAKVFIATSGKVDGDRSPFTFEEKRKMMILAGVSPSDIVQTKSPYQSIEIMERFDKDTTVMVFAVSEKDMAEDPRFDFSNGLKLKKNGEPAYLQKWTNLNDAETFATRGYIATTPTFKFKVRGQEINSASQIRNMIAQSDDTKLTQMLQDLYSITDVPDDIIEIFKRKVGNKETMNENWDEHSFYKFLQESINEENTMKDGILQTITEGKSPHKKGTKKYNAHMAAIHAESYDEEFDVKVKQVVESKLKNVAADIKDYVDDHKEHFDAYPMDVEVNGKVYDFDEYWKILDAVYPDSYDNKYAVEGKEQLEEANEDSIDAIYSNDGKTITISDYEPQGMANAHKKFNLKKQIHRGENGKLITSPWGGYKVSFHGDAEDVKAYAKNHLGESVNEAGGEFAQPIYDLINDLGGDNDAHEIVLNDMVRYLGSDTIKDFVADFRRNNDLGESIEEAQVLAHGGKGQYKAVSDGGVVRIMHKGKEIASGDFDSGADGWFVSREDDKGQKFFSDAQDMVDFFVEQKVDEHVRDSSEQGFGGQERNFIHDLSMMYDGVKRDPAGLKYLGTSEMWDEGNILKDKGKLTTLMLWVKKNKDVVEKRFSRMFGTYSNKDENGKVTASDGNQILLNIIKKIGTVNENWKDVTPAGYGPDDYDDKDVAPEDHGGDLKKMQDTYKHNEDRNNHSENILMLAQAFGDRGEIKAVEGLLKIIKRQGYTTPEQSEMMYKAIHKKYYKQLFPETETEGNEFSGALAKAKIDGKKTFDVDGKTYKVKEALSKLLDSQKTNEAGIMHYSNAKGTPEYKEGQKAAKNGEPYDSNPYSGAEKLKWSKGHNEWRHANKRKKGEPNFGARGQFEGK